MSYDLKKLRQAVDAQIPAPESDGLRLRERDVRRRNRGTQISRMISAAAAALIMALTFLSLLPKGPGRDHVGNVLSQGGAQGPGVSIAPFTAPEPTDAVVQTEPAVLSEDMSLYEAWYSAQWGSSMFREEREFGDVVIRRQEDGKFVFEYKDGGQALPGQWEQAFAYFMMAGTGLVGDGEGMALLREDGLITDYIYDNLDYMGADTAFAQIRKGYEGYTEGFTIISVRTGEPLTEERYHEIGYTGDRETTLIMGVRRELEQTDDGPQPIGKILYTDVMDITGRIIVRCNELCHVNEGILGVRMDETSEIMLMDMEGNPLYGGRQFMLIGERRNGMQIVYDNGWCVLAEDGSWVIEPDTYLSVRFGPDNTFIITDIEGVTREINLLGEDVSSTWLKFRMWVKKAWESFCEWLGTFGMLGGLTLGATVGWLIIRLGQARRRNDLIHMLVAEAGWAALILGLMLISHREHMGIVQLWPTDTDTSGSLQAAWGYGILAVGGLIAMIGAWRWMRRPKRAIIAGGLILLLPWVFKCLCADMSVRDWRILSGIVFTVYLVLIVVLLKAGFVRQFMEWCKTLDALNEYSHFSRGVWYVLVLAALVNFSLGTYMSGQGMNQATYSTEVLRGGGEAYGAEWIEQINEVSAGYRASGMEMADYLEEHLGDTDWEIVHAVRWMENNGIDQLTGDMLYRLKVSGTLELKRRAQAQVYVFADDPAVWVLNSSSPVSENGKIETNCVLLVPPHTEPMPEISASVYITQPRNEWIASQWNYEISLGVVLEDMGHPENMNPGSTIRRTIGPAGMMAAGVSEAIIGGADSPAGIWVMDDEGEIIGGGSRPEEMREVGAGN